MKKLVLIDGHALVHRAYHALPSLSANSGEMVNAVFGFTSILLRILKDLKPDYIAATFDLPGPTFRHEEFEAYKAQRVKAPDELYAQLKRVKDVLDAFNIPYFEQAGFEADDLLGTIVAQVKKNNKETAVIIATGDLDTLQLVDKKVSIYTLKKGVKETIIYDEAAVNKRYGLKPDQMNDYKGLKGDPSDNIPGVPGIGEKTAISLLKEHGSMEKLYQHLEKGEKIKNKKLAEKLLAAKEQAFFSKYLATIKTDVPIQFDLAAAVAHDYDKNKVIALFKELGFFSLVKRLEENGAGQSADNQKEAQTLFAAPAGREANAKKISEPAGDEAKNIYEKIEAAKQAGVLSEKIYQVEKDLVPVIMAMQQVGIKINSDYLRSLGEGLAERLAELEKEIYRLAGINFNISSPQQLSEILFERLKISIKGLKKTPGKVISTAAPELFKLKGQHPIIDSVLEYRELAKLKNTYVDALPELAVRDGRLHTTFDQLGTTTGRLSSKNPNLQNIPIKTELGREIRKAFVAEKGYKLLAADYSQIELRIVATLAQDRKMIEVLKRGDDIHTLTAAEVFDVLPEEVSSSQRRAAKTLNFGVIYGMSVGGFAQATGFPTDKAKVFIKKYFDEFSGVARYVDDIKKEAAERGYVETLFGRKRFIPEINSSAWNLRAAAERMAINMPVQGTAADLIKMAMVEIAKSNKLSAIGSKLLLQVHDEMVFEVPEKEVEAAAGQIREIMENIYELAVPLKIEIKAGENWGEMEKINI